MPESEPPDATEIDLAEVAPAEELAALEETVNLLLEALESLRKRAEEAEAGHANLRRALERSSGEESDDVEERLRRLSEENERLRELLDRGREKAERIRSRLILLEDEKG